MHQTEHIFKDGTTGPQAKKVPAKIRARLEQILTEARRKNGGLHNGDQTDR